MVFMDPARQNGPGRNDEDAEFGEPGGTGMATQTRQDSDITAVPRAAFIMGVRLLGQIQRALGDDSTAPEIAQRNAQQAVEADRARAAARAELRSRFQGRISG